LRLLLEEYGPKIVYIKDIHNTVADTISQLEYDPSVNQTAESNHMMKVRNSKRSQRQSWMTVSKHWCNLKIGNNKHGDLNFAFANHGEEDEIYPLTTIEIAEAQRKDQELKVYYKKKGKTGKYHGLVIFTWKMPHLYLFLCKEKAKALRCGICHFLPKKNAKIPKKDIYLQLVEDTKVLCKDGKLIIPASLRHRAVAWYHHYLQHHGHSRLEETMRSMMYWKGMRTTP
jgi:hypothetical protein